jgi:hypothetical protein
MTATVEYEVVQEIGPVEIRRYPSMTLATVYSASDNEAFGILFDYISGNNEPNQRIAMTAPVISKRPAGAKIAMTAPVISGPGSFSFVLPSTYNVQTAPRPRNPEIKLEQVPARSLAVVKFGGRAHEHDISEEERILSETLIKNKILSKGSPFLMRYNSPFTPGFLRHNELVIEIVVE